MFSSVLKNQVRNLARVVSRSPVMMPSFKGGTLDADDVEIARQLLARPESYRDDEPVTLFEKEFAKFNGSRVAFAFDSGRVALSAILQSLSIEQGAEVIVPGYTCVVVDNAIRFAGLTPVYCDIELDTFGPDAASVESRLTKKTRVVILQHLFGLVCRDILRLQALAKSRGLYLIEDCAHATGAQFDGKNVGNFGDAAFYSCEQSKVMTTIMGGLAITNDQHLAGRLEEVRQSMGRTADAVVEKLLYNVPLTYYACKHPRRWAFQDFAEFRWGHYQVETTTASEMAGRMPDGYGCRMPGPLARIGLNQLRKLPAYNAQRRRRATVWDKWCDQNGVKRPVVLSRSNPVFLRYPVLVEPAMKANRRWAHKELGVNVGLWFRSHLHPAATQVDGCPNADRAVQRCINFPTLMH